MQTGDQIAVGGHVHTVSLEQNGILFYKNEYGSYVRVSPAAYVIRTVQQARQDKIKKLWSTL